MNHACGDDVWSIDAGTISNFDRARLFVDRAKLVLDVIFHDPACRQDAVKRHRISRSYIASVIGCGSSLPYQSREIRLLLERADERLSIEKLKRSSGRSDLRARYMVLERAVEELQARVESQDKVIGALLERKSASLPIDNASETLAKRRLRTSARPARRARR